MKCELFDIQNALKACRSTLGNLEQLDAAVAATAAAATSSSASSSSSTDSSLTSFSSMQTSIAAPTLTKTTENAALPKKNTCCNHNPRKSLRHFKWYTHHHHHHNRKRRPQLHRKHRNVSSSSYTLYNSVDDYTSADEQPSSSSGYPSTS